LIDAGRASADLSPAAPRRRSAEPFRAPRSASRRPLCA